MPRIRAELPAPLSKRELLLWLADQRETVHNGWTERTSSGGRVVLDTDALRDLRAIAQLEDIIGALHGAAIAQAAARRERRNPRAPGGEK